MAARQDEEGDDSADEDWEQKKRKNTVEWQKQLDERGLVEISENGKGLRLCALYRTSGDGRPPRAVTPNSSDEKWWRMNQPRHGPNSLPDFALFDLVPGLKWEKIGRVKPKTGTEISNASLSSALRSQLTLRPGAVPKFSTEKLQDFEVPNLSYDDYVKVDDTYYKARVPNGEKHRETHKKRQVEELVDELCLYQEGDEALCAADLIWRTCTVLEVKDRKIQVDIEGEKHRWMEIRDPRGLRVLNRTVHLKNLPESIRGKFVICESPSDCSACHALGGGGPNKENKELRSSHHADVGRARSPEKKFGTLYLTSTGEEQEEEGDEEGDEENPAGPQGEKEKGEKGKKKKGRRGLSEALDFTHLQGLKEPHADAIISAISIRNSRRSLKSTQFEVDAFEAVKAQVYQAIEDAVNTARKMHPFVHNANYDTDMCPDICDPEEMHFHDNYGGEACYRCGEGGQLFSCERCIAGRLGLKWKAVGPEKPSTGGGTEIKSPLLAAALQEKVDFKKEEWEMFQVGNLSSKSYIKAGDRYFKPADGRAADFCVHWECKERPDTGIEEGADLAAMPDWLCPDCKTEEFNNSRDRTASVKDDEHTKFLDGLFQPDVERRLNAQGMCEMSFTIPEIEALPKKFGIGCIQGPSGSGKTVLLGRFDYEQQQQDDWLEATAVISQVDPDPKEAMNRLMAVGICSYNDMKKPFKDLSMGQKDSARMARSLQNGATFDEFGSTLDPWGVWKLCRKLRRFVFRQGLGNVVVATCNPLVSSLLRPDWVIATGLGTDKVKCKQTNWTPDHFPSDDNYIHNTHRVEGALEAAFVSIRQHTSAYVSIRQHSSAYVC